MATSPNSTKKKTWIKLSLPRALTAVAVLIAVGDICAAATVQPKSFPSPEEAARAAVAAAKADDQKELLAIFGPQAQQVLFSGDPVADKHRREEFLAAYDANNRLETEGEAKILVVGKDWPFPIPIVKKGQSWVFDTEKGKQEILNRRIGENELNTIQTCLAIVDAQREYAIKYGNRDGLLEYAQKFASDPGRHNGLYWEAKAREPQSPLGPLVVQARGEGYQRQAGHGPIPYHGYYYRILTAQGKNAPGGAYSYLVKGKMIGGFALVAFPAE
jgi:hypothetical protein